MTVPKSMFDLGGEWAHLMYLLEDGFDEETGEYVNGGDLDEALAALTEDVNEKLCGCAFVLLRMKREADAIKEESRRLADRAAAVLRARERLEERVRALMATTGTSKAKAPGISVTLAKAPKRVEIVGPLDPRWMTVPVLPEPRPMLNEIKAALKSGEEIEGAELVDGRRSLRIR